MLSLYTKNNPIYFVRERNDNNLSSKVSLGKILWTFFTYNISSLENMAILKDKYDTAIVIATDTNIEIERDTDSDRNIT